MLDDRGVIFSTSNLNPLECDSNSDVIDQNLLHRFDINTYSSSEMFQL